MLICSTSSPGRHRPTAMATASYGEVLRSAYMSPRGAAPDREGGARCSPVTSHQAPPGTGSELAGPVAPLPSRGPHMLPDPSADAADRARPASRTDIPTSYDERTVLTSMLDYVRATVGGAR